MSKIQQPMITALLCLIMIAVFSLQTVRAEESSAEPSLGGDFTLTKHDGTSFNLSDIEGYVGIIFFGFTHCPDVCPNTLMDIQRLLISLEDQQDQLKILFISVDPNRDTPQKLESYVHYFNKNMIGLTGSDEEIAMVLSQYNATVSYKGDMSGNDYQVEHNANLFLIDKHGDIGSIILPRTPFSVLKQQVLKLIDQTN
jgi:protein SCO1/2